MSGEPDDLPSDDAFVRDPIVPGGRLSQETHFELLSAPNFDGIKQDYIDRFANMVVQPGRVAEVTRLAARIASFRTRYEGVGSTLKIPWPVVGLVHEKEAGLNFNCHLHNGDPLTARTVQVPKGRPVTGNPPFTWEDSAIDALTFDGLNQNTDWSLAKIAFLLERFNGFGYRHLSPPVPTPYLWAFTNQYEKGHFVADGVFDANAVAKNCGAMPLLAQLIKTGDAGPLPLAVT